MGACNQPEPKPEASSPSPVTLHKWGGLPFLFRQLFDALGLFYSGMNSKTSLSKYKLNSLRKTSKGAEKRGRASQMQEAVCFKALLLYVGHKQSLWAEQAREMYLLPKAGSWVSSEHSKGNGAYF